MPSEVTLSTEQKVLIVAEPVTEAGNPAPIDGAVAFAVTSGTCTIQAVDGTSAYVVSGNAPGDSLITMTCDADLGAGITTVTDTLTAHVVSATAASLDVTVGEPELK
jgi:hypothetical protein